MKLIGTNWVIAAAIACLAACSSMGSTASSAYQMLGGTKGVESLASNFLNSSLKDPSLSGLTSAKNFDSASATTKLSNQLCSSLGGDCKAPLTDQQVSSAASKLTPDQSKAITNNFSSALSKVTSDPTVSQLVTKTVGNKVPGILASLF
jgi:truncated hemoglobin YjbI